MHRRGYLALGGAALSSILAGCGGSSDDTDTGGGNGNDNNDDNGATPASADTPTETESDADADESVDEMEIPDPVEHEFNGSGSDVLGPFDIELFGPVVVAMQHEGDSNFQVELLDGDGETIEFLANAIGAWSGANATEAPPATYRLDVEADGDWRIRVTSHPEYFADDVSTDFPVAFDGTTDDVFGPINFESGRTISWACEGDRNNIIWVREATGAHGDLVLNEIGPDDGAGVASIRSGVGWIDVETSGTFEITIEE